MHDIGNDIKFESGFERVTKQKDLHWKRRRKLIKMVTAPDSPVVDYGKRASDNERNRDLATDVNFSGARASSSGEA